MQYVCIHVCEILKHFSSHTGLPLASWCWKLRENSESEGKGFNEGFWSKAEIKDTFLDEQREYIWNKDYFRNVLVPLFGLKQDSVVLDVGCGLGFLGLSLMEFIPTGKMIGVDLDPKLLEEAKRRADKKLLSGVVDFRVGNAYELPFDDAMFDLSVCQTLLMHLDEPIKAIYEMKRVVKKGGRVVAIEPDHSSRAFFDTAYETMGLSLEQRGRVWRWDRILTIGKKKLGRGDNEIGSKVPYLFFQSGLRVVDVRCWDKTFWLIPPYQGHELEIKHLQLPPEEWVKHFDLRTEFLAGGGTEKEWSEYFNLMKKAHEIHQKQIKEGTFANLTFHAATITVAEKT